MPNKLRKKIGYLLRLFKFSTLIFLTLGPKGFYFMTKRYLHKHRVEFKKTNPLIHYAKWLKENTPKKHYLNYLNQQIDRFSFQPKFLIVILKSNKKNLEKTLQSLGAQIYRNFEIITEAKLQKIGKLSDQNFVFFLNAGDALSIDCLAEFAANINHNVKMIYSDHDYFDKEFKRSNPQFKPDFSEETIISYDYIKNTVCFKVSILKKIKGLTLNPYDLILKCSEVIYTDEVLHISKVLFSKITLKEENNKSAVQSAVKRRKLNATVELGILPNTFRVKYKIVGKPLISIIIPTFNQHDLLKKCINSIEKKSQYKHYEIIVVDNNSNDPESLTYLERLAEKHKVIKFPYPFNYSKVINFGVKEAKGDYLLFLNNDIEVISPDWISAMLEYAQLEDIALVGAKLLYPNEKIQHSGVVMGMTGVADHLHKSLSKDDSGYMNRLQIIQNFAAVTGACTMIKKSLFEELGGYNEKLPVNFNDVELCLEALEKGYRNVYTPYATLYHHESISRGMDKSMRKIVRAQKEAYSMFRNWERIIENDPYFNINLPRYNTDLGLEK
jgi:GT2 family glycosyltransferase